MDSLKNLRYPKAMFFDWDGTLVDSFQSLCNAHNYVRDWYGLEKLTPEQHKDNMKYSGRELYPKIYGDRAQEALDKVLEYFLIHGYADLKPMTGAEKILRALADDGMPLAVISNKRHEVLVGEMAHIGWAPLFRKFVGAGYGEHDKPAPDALLRMRQELGINGDPAEIWYIGDTEPDLRASQAAGFTAVLLLQNHDKSALIEQYQPALALPGCGEILETVAALKTLAA